MSDESDRKLAYSYIAALVRRSLGRAVLSVAVRKEVTRIADQMAAAGGIPVHYGASTLKRGTNGVET